MTGQSRQLAAIMYTDVVGYTGMMQRDEKDTIIKLEHHRLLIEEEVINYEGKILQYYGDGSLIIFNSALNAVLCGIRIQEIFQKTNIPLRIGIHLGEVIIKGGIVFGDGLNIAARLESIGVRGSVLISGAIFDQIHNQPEIKFKYLGKFRLKNVISPLAVYSILNNGIPVPDKKNVKNHIKILGKPFLRLKSRIFFYLISIILLLLISAISLKYYIHSQKSENGCIVAVLPFENLSEDSTQIIFCKGMTEEIQTGLSKITGIHIIPGIITTQYFQSGPTLQQIGKDLGASVILRGSVRKSGNRLRIFAELININNNIQLWSETYDADESPTLKLQRDIALKISTALRVQLAKINKQVNHEGFAANTWHYLTGSNGF
jgi:adenylate cyclase